MASSLPQNGVTGNSGLNLPNPTLRALWDYFRVARQSGLWRSPDGPERSLSDSAIYSLEIWQCPIGENRMSLPPACLNRVKTIRVSLAIRIFSVIPGLLVDYKLSTSNSHQPAPTPHQDVPRLASCNVLFVHYQRKFSTSIKSLLTWSRWLYRINRSSGESASPRVTDRGIVTIVEI